MDVFEVHREVIEDYQAFTSGFVEVRDRRIKAFVDEQFAAGVQWPHPWLSLNPSFASGGSVPELVAEGLLHPECERIFRRKTSVTDSGRDPIVLHQHQREAVEAAQSGDSYVLTTGTGSGKSLAYIVPIVDAVLRDRDNYGGARRSGVKAIVVYPMNALANSQLGELEKFLSYGYPEGEEPVTYARYTGQESPDERRRILADPPDILLTNYVMLELVLTRPDERRHLVRAAQGLRFLALDELHTYRGRQGADVAMLIRRLRDQCAQGDLQIIGTSATMSSEGTTEQRRAVVAQVATRLFGTTVRPERVIGETLVRATPESADDGAALAASVRALLVDPEHHRDAGTLLADPLAAWAETTFGLDIEPETERLVRRAPTTVPAAADDLAELTALSADDCAEALRHVLRAGSRTSDPVTGRPLFAFRLHQFLSKGDTVYVSLEPEDTRHVTGTYQVSVPGEPGKSLLPLGFCRECGQEYLVVAKVDRHGDTVFVPRRDADASGGDAVTGYLYVSSDLPWPDDPLAAGRLPDAWLVTDPATDQIDVLDSKRKYLPTKVTLSPDGTLDPDGAGLPAWFVSTPFAFCMRCGVSYEQVRGNDFGKLATLDAEGRSSAVTVLSTAVVRALRQVPAAELDPRARKLLTFVDNRQDASLQSGHLNDFVQVAQLRSALVRALGTAGPGGLGHEDVAAAVTSSLNLTPHDYSQAPEAKFAAKADAERALRGVVEYQLYVDLQRGWRVTMPNLEQCGLLQIGYRDLPELAADDDSWAGSPLLAATPAAHRAELSRIILDELRRVRAIDADVLTEDGYERMKKASRGQLVEPWALADDDRMVEVGVAFPRPARRGSRGVLALTGRGAFGRYLRRDISGVPGAASLKSADADVVIAELLDVLATAGLLTTSDTADGPEYRLKSAALRWLPGDGVHGAEDPLRRAFQGEATARVNPFFVTLYRDMAAQFAGLLAREHTAQVPQQLRLDREDEFRAGHLPLLYCSPTMELGVDISDLNAVAMRNVPPTPANYAQRSGRAGRSGQQALVLTYCSTGNAHDSYWFRRSRDMVSGSVIAPRIDLTNEDLVRSHVHAIWLAETDESLHSSVTDLVESGGDDPALTLYPQLWHTLNDPAVTLRAQHTADRVLADLRRTWELDGHEPSWWYDGWVHDQVAGAAQALDDALDRWRELYRAALAEVNEQHKLAISTTASRWDRQLAERRRADARNQLTLLRNDDSEQGATDFYSYRYFASQGFLPGYSFPRLPLAAYIPGRRGTARDGDYLQRPRFVAISEFGPGSLIYHEGARYEVVRIQLPRDPDRAADGGALTDTARRCESCGYHHTTAVGTDMCQHCGAPLGRTEFSLLRLQTVFTRRRERISSDEEERRKSGFELEVSFRFAVAGDRPSSTKARGVSDGRTLVDLVHGAAADVRVANVGRRRRKNQNDRGYWLDLREGRWLTDKQATDTPVDTEALVDAQDIRDKAKVIPYVEDRRNVLVLRLTDAVDDTVAVTLRAALERAIEATFQLEDSELDSEPLPDPDDRARMLLIEAAEGGAGVLVRLVEDPGALAAVARTALEIIHYDPDTGADLDHAPGARERCEKGCYDCLLSYGNQYEHSLIDRHSVVPLLHSLAAAQVHGGAGGRTRADQRDQLTRLSDSGLEREFVTWLDEHGHRLPDDAQVTVDAARARPDLVYYLDGARIAVFVDGPHHDDAVQAQRDAAATERLEDLGWTVLRIRYDDDKAAFTARHSWVFGPGRTPA
ncbi:MAG: DEAD/DEAH box helicase [Frankiales bacterium]|nr:DEAD/DEAH box helicase [Frankiales bacterium]